MVNTLRWVKLTGHVAQTQYMIPTHNKYYFVTCSNRHNTTVKIAYIYHGIEGTQVKANYKLGA